MADAINRLRGLMEKATKGPWHVFTNRHPETDGSQWGCIEARRHPAGGAGCPPAGMSAMAWKGQSGQANAALIVAAVNALPALLAVAEAAKNYATSGSECDREDLCIALANIEKHNG